MLRQPLRPLPCLYAFEYALFLFVKPVVIVDPVDVSRHIVTWVRSRVGNSGRIGVDVRRNRACGPVRNILWITLCRGYCTIGLSLWITRRFLWITTPSLWITSRNLWIWLWIVAAGHAVGLWITLWIFLWGTKIFPR